MILPIVLISLLFLFSFIAIRLKMNNNPVSEYSPSFLKMKLELEKESNKRKQEREDRQFERDAKMTALEDFTNWMMQQDTIFNGKNYDKTGLIISVPRRCFYNIYDEDTAKYLETKFSYLVKDEFDKLKGKYNLSCS